MAKNNFPSEFMSIAKVPVILLSLLYIYYQVLFIRDFGRVHNHIKSDYGDGFFSIIYATINMIFTPGGLVGISSVFIIFSMKFNKISRLNQWFIVASLVVLYFIGIIGSILTAGFIYIYIAWQILIAVLLFILFKRFSLIFW